MIFYAQILEYISDMEQSGSSLFNKLQNNNTPNLELLVRESIQNSLDAETKHDKSIKMKFIVDRFDGLEMNKCFPNIVNSLNKFTSNKNNDYIAIRDYNCVGLIGDFDFLQKNSKSYENQNLYSLVYNIDKSQQKEGAGGSWGLGKTIYYRFGIGMVVYYSRIYNKNTKNYQSRLIVSVVEDENNPKILSNYINSRGIGFFGQSGTNRAFPITNEGSIKEFLDIFSICPYINNETGTTIIIPYIDIKKSLSEMKNIYDTDQVDYKEPFWTRDIHEALKLSIQKWYFPRVDNINYKYGKPLDVEVNNEKLTRTEFAPLFKKLQIPFYEKSVSSPKISKIIIDHKKYPIGTFYTMKLNREELGMGSPTYFLNPFYYLGISSGDRVDNYPPIVLFNRKPGMIINYETRRPWSDETISSGSDFIFGIFVLNSNERYDGNCSIEEYFRSLENADHLSWEKDSNFDCKCAKDKLLSKVQRKVRYELRSMYIIKEEKAEEKNQTLSNKLSKLLLPPTNFGIEPKSKVVSGKRKTILTKSKDYTVSKGTPIFHKDTITFEYQFKMSSKYNKIELIPKVVTGSKEYDFSQWIEEGQHVPMKFLDASITINKVSKVEYTNYKNDFYNIIENLENSLYNFAKIKSNISGFSIIFNDNAVEECTIFLKFKIIDNSVQTNFTFNVLEFENEKI